MSFTPNNPKPPAEFEDNALLSRLIQAIEARATADNGWVQYPQEPNVFLELELEDKDEKGKDITLFIHGSTTKETTGARMFLIERGTDFTPTTWSSTKYYIRDNGIKIDAEKHISIADDSNRADFTAALAEGLRGGDIAPLVRIAEDTVQEEAEETVAALEESLAGLASIEPQEIKDLISDIQNFSLYIDKN
jgi:hypothetical protein